jgi:hypothetical protein
MKELSKQLKDLVGKELFMGIQIGSNKNTILKENYGN